MNIEDSHILLALLVYFVGAASPGPASLAIMDVAMDKGRTPAVIFASGILLGSFFWAVMSLFGVTVFLSTHANYLYALKIIGGLYFLWLSYKSVRKVYAKEDSASMDVATKTATIKLMKKKLFFQGLALHLTNPKAIFSWVAIVSLAVPQNASITTSLTVVAGCMVLGVIVFGGYAIMFSTNKAQRAYKRFGKWISGVMAVVFGVASWKLLSS